MAITKKQAEQKQQPYSFFWTAVEGYIDYYLRLNWPKVKDSEKPQVVLRYPEIRAFLSQFLVNLSEPEFYLDIPRKYEKMNWKVKVTQRGGNYALVFS